jgi:preprotein translocase subunit SecG
MHGCEGQAEDVRNCQESLHLYGAVALTATSLVKSGVMLYYLVAILYVLVCFLLLLVVLLQQGKGGDMASAFGGGGSQTAFGARAGATVLTKATTVLGVLFMLGAIGLGVLGQRGPGSLMRGLGGPAPAPAPVTAPAAAPTRVPSATPPAPTSAAPAEKAPAKKAPAPQQPAPETPKK